MYTLFVTEAQEGIINFIDAIPNVVNFGEFCELLVRVIAFSENDFIKFYK